MAADRLLLDVNTLAIALVSDHPGYEYVSNALRPGFQGAETLLDVYDRSTAKGHDVFDCFYLALARTHDADALVTTDRDFEALCDGEAVAYHNSVPDEVLSEFHRMNADSS